jgi:hypothetical protein
LAGAALYPTGLRTVHLLETGGRGEL